MSAPNTQFSIGVHIMAALAYFHGHHIRSSRLAASVQADPSLVRGVLAKLSRAGLVKTSRGRGGCCQLARLPNTISLLEIYKAVQDADVFAIHNYPVFHPCPASRYHKKQMTKVLRASQRAFEASLAKSKLSKLIEGDARLLKK